MKKISSIIISIVFFTISAYAESESVSLNYNWQPGMVSKVKYSFTKKQTYNGQIQKSIRANR